MGRKGAELVVEIITDASKAGAGIDEATSKFGKFNNTMGKLVGPATAVLGGITALGVVAVNAASDLQQAAGGVEAVFGDSANQIKAWASEAATAVGLSSAQYQTFAAQVGAQLKNLGVPMDQVAGKTDELIRMGADLAATYGGTTAEAVGALGAAFRGEADPAERYGLALNQTAVNAELAARGLTGLEGESLTAAKAAIIMEMATEQAGGAMGQFARESDSLAGAQQTLNATWADAAAELGGALLPILQPVVAALAEFGKWVQKNAAWVTPLIAIIAALAAAVIAYTVVQWALNVALTANPIGIIIVAIGVLIAAIIALGVWVANNTEQIGAFFESLWQGFMDIVGVVGEWFVSVWTSITSWFEGIWNAIAGFFKGIWSGIQSALGAVADFFTSVWEGAIYLVQSYFQFWFNMIAGVINGIRNVIGTVANWFASVWQGAVNVVISIMQTLQSVFTSVFNAIMTPIRAVIGFFNQIVSAIQNVISWLGRIKIPDIFGAIGGLFGGGRAVSSQGFAAAAPAALFGARGLSAAPPVVGVGAAASGGTVININGGLDSADTIARRIAQLLEQRDRRAHGITITRSLR